MRNLQTILQQLQAAMIKMNATHLWEGVPLDEIKTDEDVLSAFERLTILYEELFTAFHNHPDSVFVADGQGTVRYLNSCYEAYTGIPTKQIIGRSVFELEAEGLFRPSAIRLALEERREVVIFQNSLAGAFYVKCIPVFDSLGNVQMVITTARPIAEITKFHEYLQNSDGGNPREQRAADDHVLGANPKMKKVYEIVDRVKDTDSTLLIDGESGVGKGVLARYIHDSSNRANLKLIEINCGAIPKDLIESELFGYEGGAFTGANIKGKPGLFELADGGTLFLDEIGEMPLQSQTKLLKAIQDKQIFRIGGKQPVPINVRIIAATNKALKKLVQQGEFREDLYYRLNVIPIQIPALRERREDILMFAHHFLEQNIEKYNKKAVFSKALCRCFLEYPWPGNIRELENCVERLVLLSRQEMIDVADFYEHSGQKASPLPQIHQTKNMTLGEAVEALERQMITDAYQKYRSSYKVSAALGISQTNASRKIRKYIGKVD